MTVCLIKLQFLLGIRLQKFYHYQRPVKMLLGIQVILHFYINFSSGKVTCSKFCSYKFARKKKKEEEHKHRKVSCNFFLRALFFLFNLTGFYSLNAKLSVPLEMLVPEYIYVIYFNLISDFST